MKFLKRGEDTMENNESTTTKTDNTNTAHALFLDALKATAKACGLTYEEKAGWHKWVGPNNKQKVVVAKKVKDGTSAIVETTLSRNLLGEQITKNLDKPNGKIECRIVPTIENVQMALEMLADPSTPTLRPARRQSKPKAAAQAE